MLLDNWQVDEVDAGVASELMCCCSYMQQEVADLQQHVQGLQAEKQDLQQVVDSSRSVNMRQVVQLKKRNRELQLLADTSNAELQQARSDIEKLQADSARAAALQTEVQELQLRQSKLLRALSVAQDEHPDSWAHLVMQNQLKVSQRAVTEHARDIVDLQEQLSVKTAEADGYRIMCGEMQSQMDLVSQQLLVAMQATPCAMTVLQQKEEITRLKRSLRRAEDKIVTLQQEVCSLDLSHNTGWLVP